MKIYRIENDSGMGVFRSLGYGFSRIFRDSGLSSEYQDEFHPEPTCDTKLVEGFKGKRMSDYHYGFSSIDQLLTWFPNEEIRAMLNNYNFFVSVYESDDFVKGNSQACFIMESAKHEKTLSLVNLKA